MVLLKIFLNQKEKAPPRYHSKNVYALGLLYEYNVWNVFLSFQPLKNDKYRIFKSRYDSIDSYLSSCGEKYNDIDLTIDEEINKQLLDAGIHSERKKPICIKHKFGRNTLNKCKYSTSQWKSTNKCLCSEE